MTRPTVASIETSSPSLEQRRDRPRADVAERRVLDQVAYGPQAELREPPANRLADAGQRVELPRRGRRDGSAAQATLRPPAAGPHRRIPRAGGSLSRSRTPGFEYRTTRRIPTARRYSRCGAARPRRIARTPAAASPARRGRGDRPSRRTAAPPTPRSPGGRRTTRPRRDRRMTRLARSRRRDRRSRASDR